jgi:hypothetical protein
LEECLVAPNFFLKKFYGGGVFSRLAGGVALARDFNIADKRKNMWYNGNYPASYAHQPVRLREKALEIANSLLAAGVDERTASDTGLRKAREYFRLQRNTNNRVDPDLPAFP